ncbi:hypothetical protein HERIO_2018 [Hepatospora eriocheir]|uniref:GRF-type domain-containing protein n=1 Tax=Hepatospora eriocheir TaxID=1081669 RepID=A0A1X0Q8C3_9MICR|nr:hypothetical protein HERIO_2018 [Hepatospora eriocheir]
MFYKCNSDKRKCDYFQWEDEPYINKNISKNDTVLIKCYCEVDAVAKVANTSKNQGRIFYCCNKNYKKCRFFKWKDDL